ncbi:VPLPA-CTERM sorting domain-containing protein [Pseudooceanicola nitratireducens]|uniref:VPLPA-CTERM sorting domain-containing protein n=1 Tax=Pseudooceanicola nitratireducens TaxID=517719 RepID=UPI001C93857D|nr:VPLPA-CTERM sorting domain-containing protein [Pseudooceanicola nitratireducens]MBY6158486.1 VPLPA-CTERM sorting domain-containing protein [Pseudooceanicola nitratireducens]
MFLKSIVPAALAAVFFVAPVQADTITPDIIFGSGNVNRGFTVDTNQGVELGLRAKRRYSSPNDQIGVGIVQDGAGNYLISSAGQTVPWNRSVWNFDWSINSDTIDGSDSLNTYTYLMSVDYDPTAGVTMFDYDPLGAVATSYVGTNSTGNGGAGIELSGAAHSLFGNFSNNNVAQNSVNMGFLPLAPLGAGEYQVTLSAFLNGDIFASTSINVFVDTLPPAVPLPAGGVLLLTALGGLALRKARRAA